MLLANPPDDGLFADIAGHHVRVAEKASQAPGLARDAIRRCYPEADLYRQAGVLIEGQPTTVWFAYRDGRHAPNMPISQWWKSDTAPHATFRASGRLTDASPAFRSLVGMSSTLIDEGQLAASLGPDLSRELRRIARKATSSDLDGAVLIRLPRQQRRWVEFHSSRTGPGRIQIELRSVEDRDAASIRAATGIGLAAASKMERRALVSRAARHDLAPGQGLGAAGQHAWAVLVVSGIVRLLVHADGMEPTVAYASHGALLWSHLGPAEDTTPMDLEAVTPSVVIRLSPRHIGALIDSDGPFARAVIEQSQALVSATVSTLAARNAASLPQRLARELTLLSTLHPGGGLISVTEQQLADGVGSIRESVARSLGLFRRRGWIATTAYGLIVIDPAAVREYSSPNTVPAASLV